MSFLDQKPGAYKAGGRPPGATALNQIVQAVLRQLRGGTGVTVSDYGDRVTLGGHTINPQLPDVLNYISQFVVITEFDDYVLCAALVQPVDSGIFVPQVYDSTLGQQSIVLVAVAKPYQLQKAPWDGQVVSVYGVPTTYTYTSLDVRTAATSGTTTTETINFDYFPGDIITAYRTVTGLVDQDQRQIFWMDMNTAGRAWGSPVQAVAATGYESYFRGSYLNPGFAALYFAGVNNMGGLVSPRPQTLLADTIYWLPFTSTQYNSITTIVFWLNTTSPDALARVGVYKAQGNNGNLLPSSLLFDSGDMDCSVGTGPKQVRFLVITEPGQLYWIAFAANQDLSLGSFPVDDFWGIRGYDGTFWNGSSDLGFFAVGFTNQNPWVYGDLPVEASFIATTEISSNDTSFAHLPALGIGGFID